MADIRKTPLYIQHEKLKGDIVDYSGWLLPVQYEGIVAEVHGTRNKAGIFDVSHMGEFLVEGPRAAEFLQGLITNDVSRLEDGRVIYSPVCYPEGGTVDDILVYRYHGQKYLLVVNAANTAKDYAWFEEKLISGVELRDISEETALIALQGPQSQVILKDLTGTPLEMLPYYHFLPEVELAGIKCAVSRTGYTGETGFEIFCSPQEASNLWQSIWDRGRKGDAGLVPAGLGARDVLRLEASLPLYGHELSRDISPLEAGLGYFVSFDKGPFVGREALLEKKAGGLSRKLAGLVLLDRGVLREGYRVHLEGADIGFVSSGTYSPTLKKSIGMSFLPPESTLLGTEVDVIIREKAHRARVVKMPFYRRKSK